MHAAIIPQRTRTARTTSDTSTAMRTCNVRFAAHTATHMPTTAIAADDALHDYTRHAMMPMPFALSLKAHLLVTCHLYGARLVHYSNVPFPCRICPQICRRPA
jgi:hypothetical protein